MSRKILSFELDLDFILIAVSTHLKDYRLCYYINKELNTNFRKVADYCLNLSASNEPLQFSQYYFDIEASETEFYVIANYGTAGFLIPELNSVDYFILIKNHFDEEDLDHMINRLKYIDSIDSVRQIDPKSIRSNENLLF